MPAPIMTIAAYKLFFRDSLGNGWSEVYHQKPASWAGADFAALLDELMTNRREFLNQNVYIVYSSVSDVGLAGDLKAIGEGLPIAGAVNADYLGAGAAVYLRLKAAMDQFTPRLVRGVSKTDELPNGNFDGTGPVATSSDNWYGQLTTEHFGVYHQEATKRFAQYSFQDYVTGRRFVRMAHRDVGRPFGLLRGRRATTEA